MSDRALSITFCTLAFICSAVGGLFSFKALVFCGMVGVAIAAFSKK